MVMKIGGHEMWFLSEVFNTNWVADKGILSVASCSCFSLIDDTNQTLLYSCIDIQHISMKSKIYCITSKVPLDLKLISTKRKC